MRRAAKYTDALDVYESYRCGHITRKEAVGLIQRLRGHSPRFATNPYLFVGWWVARIFCCPLGFHGDIHDPLLDVPFYSKHVVCDVCGRVKVKP